MNSRFLARRSAEDFASSVDALDRIDAVDERADAHLLELVGALRSVDSPAPRATFVDDLREQLMIEAEATLSPQAVRLTLPPRTRGARERRFVAAASVAVLLGGSATMAAAAQDALPGEALYPIKRGLEQARSSLTFNEDDRGHRLLERANGRLAEASRLASSGGIGLEDRIRDTLDDFAAHTREGSTLLFASYGETGDASDVEIVRGFLATALTTLDTLTAQLPPTLHPDLSELAVLLRDLDSEAVTLCSECGSPDILELPATFLAFGEVKDALDATQKVDPDELVNNHPVRSDIAIEIPTLPSAPAGPKGDRGNRGDQPEAPAPGSGEEPAPTPDGPVTGDAPPKGLISTVVDILRQGQTTTTQPGTSKDNTGEGKNTKPSGKDGAKDPEPTPTAKPLQKLGDDLGDILGSLLGGN